MAFLFYGVEMSTVDETIIITTKEYEKLLNDQAFLRALKAAGVDNWEGFQYACEETCLEEEE